MCRVEPVPSFVTSTVAPGITAPEGSFTVPVKEPNVLWAYIHPADRKTDSNTALTQETRRIITLLNSFSESTMKQNQFPENYHKPTLSRKRLLANLANHLCS